MCLSCIGRPSCVAVATTESLQASRTTEVRPHLHVHGESVAPCGVRVLRAVQCRSAARHACASVSITKQDWSAACDRQQWVAGHSLPTPRVPRAQPPSAPWWQHLAQFRPLCCVAIARHGGHSVRAGPMGKVRMRASALALSRCSAAAWGCTHLRSGAGAPAHRKVLASSITRGFCVATLWVLFTKVVMASGTSTVT
jgi:hypothetical protein